jgi:pilus assembly protein CpaE
MTRSESHADAIQVAILTVHIDPRTVEQICQAASRMGWTLVPVNYENFFSTARLSSLTQRAIDAHACIAVVDFDEDPRLALQTAECLRQSFFHKIAILAFSSTNDPDLLLRAMRAGYSGFLGRPFDSSQFLETLEELDHRWSTTISRPQNSGKILSFFGAKGGVGTTTLAVHLAMYLVATSAKKVLLIDNHPQLGHVSLYLGMDGSQHHFYDLVQNVSRLDEELLRGFIATHPSGLDILSSPDVYGGIWKTDTDSVERTLEFLRSQYDFVVLDGEPSFDDINLAAISLSHWIYLIATPEIGAIRDLSRYVDGLVQIELATKKLQVVINRSSSHEAVRVEQIEKAIHLPIAFRIANNYSQLVQSINVGEPVPANSKSEFSSQMKQWCISLAGVPETAEPAPARKRFVPWK